MSEESVRQPGQSEAIGASSQDVGHREHAELVNVWSMVSMACLTCAADSPRRSTAPIIPFTAPSPAPIRNARSSARTGTVVRVVVRGPTTSSPTSTANGRELGGLQQHRRASEPANLPPVRHPGVRSCRDDSLGRCGGASPDLLVMPQHNGPLGHAASTGNRRTHQARPPGRGPAINGGHQ